jgi:hypothetical protein
MSLEKIIRRPETIGIFSFIIGFGLMVIIFRRPIPWQRILALNPAAFEGKEIKADGRCYKYRVEDAACEITSTK